MDDAFKLRRCIVQISERSPSHARSVIDQFLRFITPSMAKTGGADFPVTCRTHRLNSERTGGTNGQGKYPTLYFHIGNAVLGFYRALATGEAEILHLRMNLLDGIAIFGLDQFYVDGDEGTGYTLAKVEHGVSRTEQTEAAGAVDT